tara:strand:+ start:2380 stop:2544 length:165 start_codon:yes stop_codon:yes gene_type:complete
MAMISIFSFTVCSPNMNIIKEKLEIQKPTNENSSDKITYKKVPTKWVKITKKSN